MTQTEQIEALVRELDGLIIMGDEDPYLYTERAIPTLQRFITQCENDTIERCKKFILDARYEALPTKERIAFSLNQLKTPNHKPTNTNERGEG